MNKKDHFLLWLLSLAVWGFLMPIRAYGFYWATIAHSIAMIPVYEKYKDKGFTVIAIARERNRQAMENAAKKDGYPWQSLLELNDENGVWRKNGADNSGGAMYLIDRDGTILSTSTEAEELEPIIKKALNIE